MDLGRAILNLDADTGTLQRKLDEARRTAQRVTQGKHSVKVGADTKGVTNDLGRMERDVTSSMGKQEDAIKRLQGVAKGAAVGAGVGFLGSIAQSAAESEQALFGLTASYGDMAGDWANFARQMQSTTTFSDEAFMRAASGMKTLTDNYGVSTEQVRELLSASADLAAVKGIDVADASERLQSAMRGEAEASEALGLTLNDNFMSTKAMDGAYRDSWATMDDNARAQARYQEILRQTADVEGAAARARETDMGRMDVYRNQIQDLTAEWGGMLGPMQSVALALPGLHSGMIMAGGAAGGLATGVKAASLAMLGPVGLVVGVGAAAVAFGKWQLDQATEETTRLGREAGLTADQIRGLGGEGASLGQKWEAWKNEGGLVGHLLGDGQADEIARVAENNRWLADEAGRVVTAVTGATGSQQAYYNSIEQGALEASSAVANVTLSLSELASASAQYQSAYDYGAMADDLADVVLSARDLATAGDSYLSHYGNTDGVADNIRAIGLSISDLGGLSQEATDALLGMGTALDEMGTERGRVASRMNIIEEEIERLTEAGRAVPDNLRIAYTDLSGHYEQLGTDMAHTAADMTLMEDRTESLAQVISEVPDGVKVDARLADEDFQRRLGKLNEAQIDPKTGIAYLNDEDYRNKLDGIYGLRVDPKTGYIYANDQDFQEKANRVQGIRFDPKTAQIIGDNTDALGKVAEVNNAGIPTKTVDIWADAGDYYRTYYDISAQPDLHKTVYIEEQYLAASNPTAGHYAGIEGRAMGGNVEAFKPYIVGEHRAELFVPRMDGYILPSVPKTMTTAGSTRAGDTFNTTIQALDNADLMRRFESFVSLRERQRRLQGIDIDGF